MMYEIINCLDVVKKWNMEIYGVWEVRKWKIMKKKKKRCFRWCWILGEAEEEMFVWSLDEEDEVGWCLSDEDDFEIWKWCLGG